MKLHPGDKAPDISLPDAKGQTRSLREFRGKWVLVYFYPKDDTPGCTKEACGFRDRWAELKKRGVEVIGISADSAKSHAKFEEKYSLPFTLLADTEKEVIKAYGTWGKKKFVGREYMGILRQSFLIGPDGKIVKTYDTVKAAAHAEEVLKDLISLQ